VSGPPIFSHLVLNCNFTHNYYKFYKKPTLLAIKLYKLTSINDKRSQFYLHKRDRKKVMAGHQKVYIYLFRLYLSFVGRSAFIVENHCTTERFTDLGKLIFPMLVRF